MCVGVFFVCASFVVFGVVVRVFVCVYVFGIVFEYVLVCDDIECK